MPEEFGFGCAGFVEIDGVYSVIVSVKLFVNPLILLLSNKSVFVHVSPTELADRISATPALSNGNLYIRTKNSLYCFGK